MPCPRTQQANLPACSPQPPINAERQAGKLQIPFFKVFWYDSTRRMNPRSTDCEADALTTTPSRRLKVPTGIKVPFNNRASKAGKGWRHSDLSLRKPQAKSLSRATGFNKVQDQLFYSKLKEIMPQNDISPEEYSM